MNTFQVFSLSSSVLENRAKINKWDLLKLRRFCKTKNTVNKTKQQSTILEKIFNNPTLDRELITKIYKELKKLDIKISSNPVKKRGTVLNREFSTEESQMVEIHFMELFNIFSRHRNANQNNSEIPSYTCQNG